MGVRLILLLCFLKLIYSQESDICIVREQDGHSNEHDSISESHCELYDRLRHNNQSTMQIIDIDGTIAGCWLFETDSTETFYYNKNQNPSGMCSAPHYCLQYTPCTTEHQPDSYEVLYVAPTAAPTSQAPTNQGGIDIANVQTTNTPTVPRNPPSFPTHDILAIAVTCLISLGLIAWFATLRANAKSDVSYRTSV